MCHHDSKRLKRVERKITALLRMLHRTTPPAPFGPITLISRKVVDMKKLLTYHCELPPVPADQLISKQLLRVFTGETMISEAELAVDVTAADVEVVGGVDAPEATLELTHFDDEGNPSPTRRQTFTPADTIGPSQPGDFGALTLESERTVGDDDPVNPPAAH